MKEKGRCSSGLLQYVGQFNPGADYDLLLEYGAVNGRLPGRSLEETTILRDILSKWTSLHVRFVSADSTMHVENSTTFEVYDEDVISYRNYGANTLRSVLTEILNGIGHMVLALTQFLHEMAG